MKIFSCYASECGIELKFMRVEKLNDNQIIVFTTLSIVSHEPVSILRALWRIYYVIEMEGLIDYRGNRLKIIY